MGTFPMSLNKAELSCNTRDFSDRMNRIFIYPDHIPSILSNKNAYRVVRKLILRPFFGCPTAGQD